MLDQTIHLYSLQVKSSTSLLTIRREMEICRSPGIFRVPINCGTEGELTLTPVHVVTKKHCCRPVVRRLQMVLELHLLRVLMRVYTTLQMML